MTGQPLLRVVLWAALTLDGDDVVASEKLLQELLQYARLWPGDVEVVNDVVPLTSPFSTIRVPRRTLPFRIRSLSHDRLDDSLFDDHPAVVLSAAGHRYRSLSTRAEHAGVPLVYITEYSERTSRQQIRVSDLAWWRKARALQWLRTGRRRSHAAIARAAGLQCNGTPTYDELSHLSPSPLLYFDSRVRDDMIATDHDQRLRAERYASAAPTRLVFSGRLDRVKGTQFLAPLADVLRSMEHPFRLDVFGDGPEAGQLHADVDRFRLGDLVTLHGAVAFEDVLMPTVRTTADLFVCPHPQGDPSCTYLETLACGTPIVGFANEALVGMSRQSSAAWTVPLGDVGALASRITRLAQQPDELQRASSLARQFATRHTFDLTYQRRVDHLLSVART